MKGRQHSDDTREVGQNKGAGSQPDRNAARNTYRHILPQQRENLHPRGIPASDSYRESNLSNAVPGNTVNVGPTVRHRDQILLPPAGADTTGRGVHPDSDLQASPYNAAPGNPVHPSFATGTGDPQIPTPLRRVVGTHFPRDDNSFNVVGGPPRQRPASRHIPPSAQHLHQPTAGHGASIRNPHQQLSRPQHLTSYAFPGYADPHGAGTRNPYLGPNALSADAPRQPSDDFGVPPVPRTRGNGGQSTVRRGVPRTNLSTANRVHVNQGPRAATSFGAYEGVQARNTAQGEQPYRFGSTPDATSAYGRLTSDTPSAYSHSPSFGQSQTRGQSSAFGRYSTHDQSPRSGRSSAYGASFSPAYGSSTMYDPRSAYGSTSAYGSSGASHTTESYDSAYVTAPSEHGPSNNVATSAAHLFPAYDSHQSRRDHGLPPHLVGPEPLVPQRPVHRQNLDHRSLATNATANNGSRRGQSKLQPAAVSAGTNDTRVTPSTNRDAPTSSTKPPRAPRGRTITTRRTKRTPGRISHGEIQESLDGSIRFRAEGANKWEPTTHHEENRRAMIDWAGRFGQYTHPPTHGPHPDDETSYHPNQQAWRFQGHHGWHQSQDTPMYRFQRDGYGVLDYTPGPLRWRGRVVLNRENVPITDWRNMPLTCASVIEGGRMEQIQRDDARITNEDFQDRQPAWSGNRPLPGLSAMGNRKRRFRENNGLASWEKREGTKRITDLIRSHLSDEQQANNTTRGFDRLSRQELQDIKDDNAKSGYFKTRAGTKALTDDEKRRRAQEEQAKSRKRKRDESDDQDVGDDGEGPDSDEQP